MEALNFTAEKPKESGYYYVIWEEGDAPELVYINYLVIDGEELWTWGHNENDDPEDITLDIAFPEAIQFSKG